MGMWVAYSSTLDCHLENVGEDGSHGRCAAGSLLIPEVHHLCCWDVNHQETNTGYVRDGRVTSVWQCYFLCPVGCQEVWIRKGGHHQIFGCQEVCISKGGHHQIFGCQEVCISKGGHHQIFDCQEVCISKDGYHQIFDCQEMWISKGGHHQIINCKEVCISKGGHHQIINCQEVYKQRWALSNH